MAIASVQVPERRLEKSAHAFRTISEVATELDVQQHVLRFWESKFTQVRPLKRGGGRRYYRPEDIDLLRRIRSLLYDDGYTIKGVQRLLKESRGRLNPREEGATLPEPRLFDVDSHGDLPRTGPRTPRIDPAKRREVEGVLDDLKSALDLLRKTLHAA
jgi:DNA-binding transcriptional MerR regulator